MMNECSHETSPYRIIRTRSGCVREARARPGGAGLPRGVVIIVVGEDVPALESIAVTVIPRAELNCTCDCLTVIPDVDVGWLDFARFQDRCW